MMDLLTTETHQIYKVSEVTSIVKDILENCPIANLWVEGEVSSSRKPASGHIYFTLKDASSQIKCVLFKSEASRMRFIPEDGISVVLFGELTVYEPRGEYQIVVKRIEPLGLGALQLAFEQLKKRLEAEGLFDESHKKPIPLVPQRVGVVTSSTGAAIKDILNVMGRRFSNVSVLLYPVRVQGESAPQEIAEAIKVMNDLGNLDVLIVGRGGGSVEDLWAFNEEIVARSIYASEIPVISAVGHEIDFTIADFVADRRAPTPSAAAEMVVANKIDLVRRLNDLKSRMYGSINSRTQLLQKQTENLQGRLLSRSGRERIQLFQQKIDELLSKAHNMIINSIQQRRNLRDSYEQKLMYVGVPARIHEIKKEVWNFEQRCFVSIEHILESKRDKFGKLTAELNALSPLSILQRGYSICTQYPSKTLLKDANQVSIGDKVGVKLAKGELTCKVEEINS
jgi:exodeoxyribonuclease VII large subunit